MNQLHDRQVAAVTDLAEAMLPRLRARAAQTEQRGQLPHETVTELHKEGLLSLVKPKCHGGLELPLESVLQVCAVLGRGCASTGWVATVLNVHHWVAALFPEAAQRAYFEKADVLSAASFAPTGTAVIGEGGFVANGRWSFASGVDHCDWVFLAATVAEPAPGEKPGPYFLLVPAADYTVDHDSWHVAGLRGTGSKDVLLDDCFVPIERAVFMPLLLGGNGPGTQLHDGDIYHLPAHPLLVAVLAAPVVGAVQHGLELFTERTRVRRFPHTGGKQAEQPTAHVALAEAAANLSAAQALLRQVFDELAHLHSDMPRAELARVPRDTAFAMRLLRAAIDIVFTHSGGGALQDANPIQRIWRDVHAASAHAALSWTSQAQAWGQAEIEADVR